MKNAISTLALALTVALGATARADEPATAKEIRYLHNVSSELEGTLRDVQNWVEVGAMGRSLSESRASNIVDRFHQEARLFRIKVQNAAEEGEVPGRSDYRRLLRAYDRATGAVNHLQFYGTATVSDFEEVHELMESLDDYYREERG